MSPERFSLRTLPNTGFSSPISSTSQHSSTPFPTDETHCCSLRYSNSPHIIRTPSDQGYYPIVCVCMCVCVCVCSCYVVSDSLGPRGLWPTSFLCPWNSPGRNTGVGCHCLLQGIFPTQESYIYFYNFCDFVFFSLSLSFSSSFL